MMRFAIKPCFRPVYVLVEDTLKLRKVIRERLGRRRSAKMRYRQIGTNSFIVENPLRFTVLSAWRV